MAQHEYTILCNKFCSVETIYYVGAEFEEIGNIKREQLVRYLTWDWQAWIWAIICQYLAIFVYVTQTLVDIVDLDDKWIAFFHHRSFFAVIVSLVLEINRLTGWKWVLITSIIVSSHGCKRGEICSLLWNVIRVFCMSN